jgi:hypothetical protein
MRKQRDPGQRKRDCDGANCAAPRRREQAGCGRQRPHVDGMTGWKGIAGPPGKGNAMPMADNCEPVRSGLVERGFQDMR